MSIRRLCVEIIEYVLTNYKGINLNVLIDGRTPLIYACYRKSYRIVKAFLDYGVDVNFKDSQNNFALAFACKVKSLKICKILIEHGAMLYNEYNMEAIKKAIKKRDIYELPYVSVYNIYGTRKNKYWIFLPFLLIYIEKVIIIAIQSNAVACFGLFLL